MDFSGPILRWFIRDFLPIFTPYVILGVAGIVAALLVLTR